MKIQSFKPKYNIVFVVLVYRNTLDLKDFFQSNKITDAHTIVVVSHHDDDTDLIFAEIAKENNADILFVPNEGYGSGNNKGVEYAIKNYSFNYLIISNADIKIKSLKASDLEQYDNVIIAPEIIASSGRKQNPSEPFRPSKIVHKIAYKLYRGDHSSLIWIFYAWCRIKRIIYNILPNKYNEGTIYAAHGAFVILPINVLKQLEPLYNEKMFLMNEEGHLAKKALQKGIKTRYVKTIIVEHKEDGSMSFEYKNEFPLLKQSFIEFYKYWYLA